VGRIWMIGGTQESASLARSLVQANLPCIVSVTTDSARSLYPNSPLLTVWVGQLTQATITAFLKQYEIQVILDASHPFAVEISQFAIAAATTTGIPYLRFERASIGPAPLPTADSQTDDQDAPRPIVFSHLSELLKTPLLTGQHVLLTLGYRYLPLFQPWQTQATLYARILPSIVALETAIAAGFTPDRLIALRPPISAQLECALWQQWNISVVVTKASGKAGGEDIKRQVAAELGVKLVMIDRPPIPYPEQTSEIPRAIAFCQQHLLN